ncbi:hypothetical protein MTO96_048754 [Rhipicephalus appendiculatus]
MAKRVWFLVRHRIKEPTPTSGTAELEQADSPLEGASQPAGLLTASQRCGVEAKYA